MRIPPSPPNRSALPRRASRLSRVMKRFSSVLDELSSVKTSPSPSSLSSVYDLLITHDHRMLSPLNRYKRALPFDFTIVVGGTIPFPPRVRSSPFKTPTFRSTPFGHVALSFFFLDMSIPRVIKFQLACFMSAAILFSLDLSKLRDFPSSPSFLS